MRVSPWLFAVAAAIGCAGDEPAADADGDALALAAGTDAALVRAALWFAAPLSGDTTDFAPHLSPRVSGNVQGREVSRSDVLDGILQAGPSWDQGHWQCVSGQSSAVPAP